MILYQVITTYHLLSAIVHKQAKHKDEKAVLLVSTWIVSKFPNYKELIDFFDDVIVFDPTIRDKDLKKSSQNSNYCKGVLNSKGYALKNFSEIHSMGCQHNFGIFLAHDKIPFYFWEEAAGILSNYEVLANIEKGLCSSYKVNYCLTNGLYDGTAPSVLKRVCNFKAQKKNFDFENAVDFDLVAEMLMIPKQELKKIRGFFSDIEDLSTPKDSVLLLTQHFANLKILSFEDHALIYQLVVDYFFNNKNLAIKTHPDDNMYYGYLFPRAKIIREKFPSEFLSTLFSNKPKTIATISSTAISNIKSYFEESFELGTRFERDFKAIHRYYAIAKLKEKVCPQAKLEMIGANEKLLNKLCLIGSENNKQKFYVVDDLSSQNEYKKEDILELLSNLATGDVVAFTNFKQDYCFHSLGNKKVWKNIVPITISKTQEREQEFYDNLDEEVVYIYTKSEDVAKQIEDFELIKNLEATGETVQIKGQSGEKKSVKVLEGLLKVSENLLNHLIVLEKKSDKEQLNYIAENYKRDTAITFSSKTLKVEDISEDEKKIRILEGEIDAVEQRMLFYIENTEEKK